jgi:hypothetical protein
MPNTLYAVEGYSPETKLELGFGEEKILEKSSV